MRAARADPGPLPPAPSSMARRTANVDAPGPPHRPAPSARAFRLRQPPKAGGALRSRRRLPVVVRTDWTLTRDAKQPAVRDSRLNAGDAGERRSSITAADQRAAGERGDECRYSAAMAAGPISPIAVAAMLAAGIKGL
jgi:hypothetical protein